MSERFQLASSGLFPSDDSGNRLLDHL
jgi:hypothetical protein